MSKGSDGPAAATFTNPRKTGWLYKHGGSGFSSHWKKRWFIADHHYLFYYKGPNDKKPVGILCLPEYGSCQKADIKEWKKPFSFVLGRTEGTQEGSDSAGAAGKDYVLYSESEGDMNTWIKALQEEMKPSGMFANGGPGSATVRSAVKMEQQALEEVTKAASDGPKLTHLTAQRPRVRGRRPPKRYATYHEEDKEDSPPDTPPSDRKVTTTPPEPLSPLPSASPTSQKKGHRPAVPLMPKERSLTSAPPTSRVSPKNTKKLPHPPSKPLTAKEGEAVEIAPIPKQRPMPPKRPLKPRAATDAVLPAPRPVPAPRRAGGKEIISPSLQEEVPEQMQVITEVSVVPQASSLNTNTENEQVKKQADIQEVIEKNEEQVKEERPHVRVPELIEDTVSTDVVSKNSTGEDDKKITTPPSLPLEKGTDNHLPTEAETKEVVYPMSEVEHHGPEAPLTDSEYEHMQPGVTKEKCRSHIEATKSPEYDEPEEWNLDSPALLDQQNEGGYAIPYPVLKPEEATYDVPNSSTKAGANVVSSTPQIALVATMNEENITTGTGKSPSPSHTGGEDQLKPFRIERDALGYTKVVKQRSDDKQESPTQSDNEQPPPLWAGMEKGLVSDTVPSTLHQSREILRLAQVMKQEVEEMRREVQRELEMARRERQDAELLKRNAIEILRMAKEKLA